MSILVLGALQVASAASNPGDIVRVPEDFATIQAAIDNSRSPTIHVGPGVHEGAVINRPVNLQGEHAVIEGGPEVATSNGAFVLNAAFILKGAASRTQINGFEVDCTTGGLDLGVYSSSARFGETASHVAITNNTFSGCVQGVTNSGSAVMDCEESKRDGGSYWYVADNVFDGIRSTANGGLTTGGIGIWLRNAEYIDVLDNDFVGRIDDTPRFTTSGIALAGCRDCTVANNTFEVTGGQYYWAAISNMGFYADGAAASEDLIITENRAQHDSAPDRGINFRSYDSFNVEWADNGGRHFVDHTHCGDGVQTEGG